MPFDRPRLFDARTARHIIEATERIEAMPYPSRQYIPRTASDYGNAIFDAIVTSAIGQATSTVYGKGNATIQIDTLSGSTYTGGADPAYPAALLVLNWYTNSGTIAIGTHIEIYWRNGNFRLLTADC